MQNRTSSFPALPSRAPRRIATLGRRGGLLITALLLAAAIALSLGSFLRLAFQSSQLSYRSFYAGTAMNIAESGLEQAMWAVNKRLAGDTTVWSTGGWTTLGTGAVRRTFDFGRLSGGASAEVKVYVSSANLVGTSPFVLARSIITPPQGAPIERWVQITLSRRSRFATGVVARDLIRFNGNNASVDSYDSRLGAYNASLGGGVSNRYARGSAGSASVEVNSFTLGNADIWGFAVVGSSSSSGLNVGSQGTVGPFGTPQGTVVSDHVMTDFTANFENITHPAAYTGTGAHTIATIDSTTTLPAAGDVPAADGKYYYNIGTISLSGNNTLTVNNNVVIRMGATTGSAISVSGNGALTINNPYTVTTQTTLTLIPLVISTTQTTVTPQLEIFTEADVSISGNGVSNSGKPLNFKLWGTRPQSASTAQTISVNGNGVLSGIVYAPNGNISAHGGGNSGNIYGALVGNRVTITGNSAIHYDESLADFDSGEPFGLSEWNEFVSQADRRANAAYVAF